MAIGRATAKGIVKAATDLRGFDEMPCGGLPCGRGNVVIGGAGSGKTIFELKARKRELAMKAQTAEDTSLRSLRERDNTSILRRADEPKSAQKAK